MDNSILRTIKKLIGLDDTYTVFDQDLIVLINSVFVTLNQLGVGPTDSVFSISDDSAVWSDFCDTDIMETVKMYIYFRVRLMFDPPTSSYLIESIRREISEAEFRLLVSEDE